MIEYDITKTEARRNKDAYKQIVKHLKEEKEIKWKYKVNDTTEISVILIGSIGRKRKKVVLQTLPAYVAKKYDKDMTDAVEKAGKGELTVQWGEFNDEGSLYFCNGEDVTTAEALMLCDYFEKQRFDTLSGVLSPSLIVKLEQLGFDMSTLKFSINKKM